MCEFMTADFSVSFEFKILTLGWWFRARSCVTIGKIDTLRTVSYRMWATGTTPPIRSILMLPSNTSEVSFTELLLLYRIREFRYT